MYSNTQLWISTVLIRITLDIMKVSQNLAHYLRFNGTTLEEMISWDTNTVSTTIKDNEQLIDGFKGQHPL